MQKELWKNDRKIAENEVEKVTGLPVLNVRREGIWYWGRIRLDMRETLLLNIR